MDITPLSIASATSQAQLSAIATVLTIRFGYDWQAQDFTGSVTYTAPEQVKQFGSIERIIEAPFCPTARQATRLAEYWCSRLSVPQYIATIEADRSISHITLGDRVDIIHPHLPGGSTAGALVTGREFNPESGGLTLYLLLPASSLPTVQMSGYSGRFVQSVPKGTKVTTGSGTISLIIADDNGTPLAGAIATIDGTTSATADASGRVEFKNVAKGKHSIEVRQAGHDPFTLEIEA